MTEMQATIGREQLKLLDKQIKKRNSIANLYLHEFRDYYQKYNIFKKVDFKCKTCLPKNSKKSCTQCVHAFYRLNLFINKNKINQIKLIEELNKKKVDCGVGPCPEIYREKIFKKFKFYPKKRLINARLLGETSIMFPINPHKSLTQIKNEILKTKRVLKKYL